MSVIRVLAADRGSRPKVWLARTAVAAVTLLAVVLLWRTLSAYDYAEVVKSVRAVPPERFLMALGFAAASYLCLSMNDWLALFYARHPLPYRTAALTSFVALSFGHNIGFAALSSGAIRYRFYSRIGLGAEEVAKIIVFCGTTVLLGMCVLGVVALLAQPDLAAEFLHLSKGATVILGAGLALVPASYLVLAAFLRRRLTLFRWTIEMPAFGLALAQIAVGTLNFMFVGGCLYALVSAVGAVSYFAVLCAFILANAATILTHVPGGLGVIETVVLLILRTPDLIGPVLVFRFVYFLVPLAIGAIVFALSEASLRRAPAKDHGRLAFTTAGRGERRAPSAAAVPADREGAYRT